MKRFVAVVGVLFSFICLYTLNGVEPSLANEFLAKSFMEEQALLLKENKGFHWSHGTSFHHRSHCHHHSHIGHHGHHGHHGCHDCCGHHGHHGHHH